MKLFDNEIVDILNKYFLEDEENVLSVKLAYYGFSIQFANIEIHSSERVFFSIAENTYEWDESPNSAPCGLLINQIAVKAILKSPLVIRIMFNSGDYLDIETIESEYEIVNFSFPPKDGVLIEEYY